MLSGKCVEIMHALGLHSLGPKVYASVHCLFLEMDVAIAVAYMLSSSMHPAFNTLLSSLPVSMATAPHAFPMPNVAPSQTPSLPASFSPPPDPLLSLFPSLSPSTSASYAFVP